MNSAESDMMLYDSYFCIFEAKPPFAITRVGHKVLPLVPDRSVPWSDIAMGNMAVTTMLTYQFELEGIVWIRCSLVSWTMNFCQTGFPLNCWFITI